MRFTLLLLCCGGCLFGQQSLFDSLYATGDTVVLRLETSWKNLLRAKDKKEYQPATVHLESLALPARVRTRGNARLRSCRYPSLLIKLRKDGLRERGFSDLNDLKLVVQCNDSRTGTAYLHRERLLYDLHAVVNPYHHRTLPIRMSVESGDTLSAFLIESEEQLEQRYRGQVIEEKAISTRGLHRDTYADLCLFNYMILNTDWNIFNLHNVECLRVDGSALPLPIPYDFDYSGMVDAHYAVPQEGLDLISVRQPAFLGRHLSEEDIRASALRFLARREQLLAIVEAADAVSDRHRRYMHNRLRAFFAEMEEESTFARLAAH